VKMLNGLVFSDEACAGSASFANYLGTFMNSTLGTLGTFDRIPIPRHHLPKSNAFCDFQLSQRIRFHMIHNHFSTKTSK
jgi:hypothetical protein